MSDPRPAHLKKYLCADPLQPDRRGSGVDRQSEQDDSEAHSKDSAERQSQTLLDDVREGYE